MENRLSRGAAHGRLPAGAEPLRGIVDHRMNEAKPVQRHSGRAGFTLIEVLVAATLLVIVFFGLADTYSRGRRQLVYEEDRRKATAVLQARMDGIRRDFGYDELPDLADTDSTFVVEGRDYVVAHQVTPGVPEDQATTITLTVTWMARVEGANVARTHACTYIIGREMPWPD